MYDKIRKMLLFLSDSAQGLWSNTQIGGDIMMWNAVH